MSKKPILLIIIFLFKSQICSGVPIANNPSCQPLASDAKNKSQNKFISKIKLSARNKTNKSSDTNKRKLEIEIETASDESQNSQFDDIANFINCNFSESTLNYLFENCKKIISKSQKISVVGVNMDIEKDKQNKEDLLSVENKKIETLNLVSGGNINKTKNRIELHSKKFYTNSLTKKTTFFNYIGLTFEQNTLSSKILIKFFKTSEEKFFYWQSKEIIPLRLLKKKSTKL